MACFSPNELSAITHIFQLVMSEDAGENTLCRITLVEVYENLDMWREDLYEFLITDIEFIDPKRVTRL